MIDDEIIRQIRATRDSFAERHNFDIQAMAATLQAAEAASGHRVVSFSPQPVPSAVPSSEVPPTRLLPCEPCDTV
jgi:hypothetical protein